MLFNYALPDDRIAQRPVSQGRSLLLHVCCGKADQLKLNDREFSELPDLLRHDDLLVLNNSRVIPSRFFVDLSEGGSRLEVLLVQQESEDASEWQALARPMRRFKTGLGFALSKHLNAVVLGRTSDSTKLCLKLTASETDLSVQELIEAEGVMPIPPYIRSGQGDDGDRLRYQTCFAEVHGSVAAPTAGLHFTEDLFERLSHKGIEHCFVTHHVGPASFLPVRDNDWRDHKMSAEQFFLPAESIEMIQAARDGRRRVVAVGTTAVRALESAWQNEKPEADTWQTTELFITPEYEFRVVDSLVTNFHQPQSTHLLLVAAILGVDRLASAYNHALSQSYRFLSYGDAMLIDCDEKGLRQC